MLSIMYYQHRRAPRIPETQVMGRVHVICSSYFSPSKEHRRCTRCKEERTYHDAVLLIEEVPGIPLEQRRRDEPCSRCAPPTPTCIGQHANALFLRWRLRRTLCRTGRQSGVALPRRRSGTPCVPENGPVCGGRDRDGRRPCIS